MSNLIGHTSARWSLSHAIDALRDSARQAGRPGLVWIVGLLYPSVGFCFWLASSTITTVGSSDTDGEASGLVVRSSAWREFFPLETVPIAMGFAVCFAIVCFPVFRLVAGLARVSPSEVWLEACENRRTPRIRTLWKSGSGMTLSVIALWLLLVVTIGLSLLAVAWPTEHLVRPFGRDALGGVGRSLFGVFLLGPLVLLFVSYALSMAVLTQLALHSLAHNRRGIGSALLHGWRIMRHDVPATSRAVIVDVLLTFAILLATTMIGSVIPFDWLDTVLGFVLSGFAGVARAAYWARAYRALGGLSPDDGVPGLPQAQ
ncbi:MAG: hypothetical protein SGI72_15985 [Planctomycetota bacterium]|nr:hypothetical protein [Planctomycetota bacterium]